MMETYNQSDFAIVNQGAHKYTWNKGNITVQDVYKMFPFDDQLYATFSINGSSLLKLISILQTGRKAYYAFAGLNISVA